MNNKKVTISNDKDFKNVGNGYKVVKVNVSNSGESLYAVCTPIQNQ